MYKSEVIRKCNPLLLKGICHRGLHDDVHSENGLGAFKNAIEHNFAFELDVHLTKDSELVVCHDSDLKRMTGKEGIIEELTLKEIKENYRLPDGGELPTLQQVLELTNEIVPIVIELKVYKLNYRPLSKRVIRELKDIRDTKNFFLISFDPRALKPLKKLGIATGLLVTPSHRKTFIFRHIFDSVDIDLLMIDEKKVRKYHEKHFLNIWTIENKEDFDRVYPYIDTVTFQHMDYNYVRERLTEKNQKYL